MLDQSVAGHVRSIAMLALETGSARDSQSIRDNDLSHDKLGGAVKTRYSLKESKQTLVVL
jgi:hypothetical protein